MAKDEFDPGTGELLELELNAQRGLLNSHGHEVVSSVPVAPPVGYKKQPSMFDRVRELIQSERLAAAARDAGFETFEESEDFDIPDDMFPASPYEDLELDLNQVRRALGSVDPKDRPKVMRAMAAQLGIDLGPPPSDVPLKSEPQPVAPSRGEGSAGPGDSPADPGKTSPGAA